MQCTIAVGFQTQTCLFAFHAFYWIVLIPCSILFILNAHIYIYVLYCNVCNEFTYALPGNQLLLCVASVVNCIVLYSALYCVVNCIVLYSTVLYCTVLYCTVLYCTVLYCTVLYCTVCLYCTALHCTVCLSVCLFCTVMFMYCSCSV